MDLLAHAMQPYVTAAAEPESIAGDVARRDRIHHSLALPTPDAFVILPASTNLSTVNALLDDALHRLHGLSTSSNVSGTVAALDDKYADIWEEIDRDRLAAQQLRLRRHFDWWRGAAKQLKAVRHHGLRGHRRRVARLFAGWRRRATQMHAVKLKATACLTTTKTRTFRAWHAWRQRHQVVQCRGQAARAHAFLRLFVRWRHFATRHVVVRRLAHQRRHVTLGGCFRAWRTFVPHLRQKRRAARSLVATLTTSLLARGLHAWQLQTAAHQRHVLQLKAEAARRHESKAMVFRHWKRQLAVVHETEQRHHVATRRRLHAHFAAWKEYWVQLRARRPSTWTPDIVALWLAAHFNLPREAVGDCHVTGHDLLALPAKLAAQSSTCPLLERLLPKLPLFFCSAEHRLQLLDGIVALSKSHATRLSKDMLDQQRATKLSAVHDYASLRHFLAQDRDLILYVRQLDTMPAEEFVHLNPNVLATAMKCHRDDHLALFHACQEQLRQAMRAPYRDDPRAADFDLATWLATLRLSQYDAAFRRHGVTTLDHVRGLTHDTLRYAMQIKSKLHRDRILQFAAATASTPSNVPRHVSPVFRVKLALANVDDDGPPTSSFGMSQPHPTHHHHPPAQVPHGAARLHKQVRTLFFAICRWLEDQPTATLERLFRTMQSGENHVTKTSFAHALRTMNMGLTSAHVHAMWQVLPSTKPHGVAYAAFIRFFVDVFEQRFAMLQLAIQTLDDRGKPEANVQLLQLTTALKRSGEILAAAGVFR
ncbi:Aste57867_10864 [Aphanomyces stellatus]|uniref:Aste57867_10864 protein n=1 Tax=Aphanomyces stellatus TaxID=120398 RepID=A0A485KRH8_9STRA|nr:hypothetical protein As57867_010824 [Aphanomyces stellatus]VFT87732.1 Aste57867_10864 [Aphanomyces stellatus]